MTYDKKKARRGYSSIPAVDPHDGGEWEVLLSHDKMKHVALHGGIGASSELAYTVPWVLKHATAIFCGVRDERDDIDDDDWLCYVSSPAFAYDHKTGEKREAW